VEECFQDQALFPWPSVFLCVLRVETLGGLDRGLDHRPDGRLRRAAVRKGIAASGRRVAGAGMMAKEASRLMVEGKARLSRRAARSLMFV
jgi:hypothetical protein